MAPPPAPSPDQGVSRTSAGGAATSPPEDVESLLSNRWVILTASVVSMIAVANFQYGWTLFVSPLQKALKAEQMELNQRTEEFAKRNPKLTELKEDQQRELQELSMEQQRIHELFQGLFPPPQAPKEGDPK